ncbi:MAG: tetratricopeptide repeat protein [Ginsengibacter sp.]
MVEKKVDVQEMDVIERARGFWGKFSKPIIYIGAAIILIGGGWLIYKYMVKLPKEEKADQAVYGTQQYFSDFSNATVDSVRTLLAQKCINGDGAISGVLKIISRYSGTAAANLCEYYAGACYLHLKQFDKSIKHLKNFTTSASQIQSRAYGMIGDAYSELKKNNDALNYYKKAADVNEKDDFTSSEFLFRAGLFAESVGKTKDAIELYKKIKTNYPLTDKAADIDRYLARLGEVNE